jgi:hypothetical protein
MIVDAFTSSDVTMFSMMKLITLKLYHETMILQFLPDIYTLNAQQVSNKLF